MKRYRTIAWLDYDGKVVLDFAGRCGGDEEEQEKAAVVIWTMDFSQEQFDAYVRDHGRENWWGIEVDWDEENEVVLEENEVVLMSA